MTVATICFGPIVYLGRISVVTGVSFLLISAAMLIEYCYNLNGVSDSQSQENTDDEARETPESQDSVTFNNVDDHSFQIYLGDEATTPAEAQEMKQSKLFRPKFGLI